MEFCHYGKVGTLALVKRKSEEAGFPHDEDTFEWCTVHCKEKSLFCKKRTCQKSVCQLCLIKYHKSHDVVDIKEEQNEKYKTSVMSRLCCGSPSLAQS